MRDALTQLRCQGEAFGWIGAAYRKRLNSIGLQAIEIAEETVNTLRIAHDRRDSALSSLLVRLSLAEVA